MTERNKKQLRFPIPSSNKRTKSLHKLKYNTGNSYLKHKVWNLFAYPWQRLRAVQRQIQSDSVDLRCFTEMLNVPPWMFALETEVRLAEVTVGESELKREAEAMFSKLQAGADLKTTLLGSQLNALLWLAKRFYSRWWLVIFSHVKNAIREVDWTYRFFTCENIAHIEFYLQGLLPKILVIYTIK